VISGFIFLSPGLPLVSFVLNEAALTLDRRKLRLSGKSRVASQELQAVKAFRATPVLEGLSPMAVAQTVFAE
jgi:hypothetical protein